MTAKSRHAADHLIDITGDVCPITFVKTKLALEKLAPGTILAVDLVGREPLENVPRSAREAGHEVLEIDPPGDTAPDAIHRVFIRRR
ncbi:MAG: sulfurtransferase TusA family protein [Rhodospirillaceae bacterium]|nr:sulfurtransferase TusA family protein [Rhodospirillaceae bacterium]